MKITLKERNMYFSTALAEEANIKKGSHVFVFSVIGENTFGFHKANKEMQKTMITYPVRSTITGNLYIIPFAPPVGLISAKMRLSYKHKITLKVRKRMLKNLPLYTLIR